MKFANPKSLSGYDKKKYVWKLLYAYMLGYDIDFGHFQALILQDLGLVSQAVELCSASKFSEKTAGLCSQMSLKEFRIKEFKIV